MIRCRFEDSKEVALRHTTVDGILFSDGRIVLVRRGEGIPESGKWALPGGYVERNETVAGALEREIFEEIRVKVTGASLFAVVSDPGRDAMDRQNISIVFVVTSWDGVPTVGEEVSSVDLFSLEEVPGEENMAADHRKIIDAYSHSLNTERAAPLVL